MTTIPIAAGTLTLVTDPTRSGLTIIPTSTALTRLNYFDGKFLRADDLRLDQTYERLLVAMSVRGSGSGVVHGFELDPAGTGDGLTLRAGLAVTPSGRVVYLPADAALTLAALLTKSGDSSFDPATAAGESAGFGPCAQPDDDGPDIALTPQPAYVVTLAPDEALCGEEERFGELCSDACLTDVDRPRRVEGVRVRARRLDLTDLPVSTQVPFTALHYRSRVASAYYAAEARQIPSLISGAGLSSRAWCDGADPVDGDEVPIALLAVSGTALQFVDVWTARRELMVEPARRYWAMRMAMRPTDVFLAQVLQFQCQLRDGMGGGGSTPSPSDPCAEERSTLRDLHDVVAELSGRLSKLDDGDRLAGFDLKATDLTRWRSLAAHAAQYLVAPSPASSGSVLIDRGIVTTPSAGYLPVDPAGDVPAQVRAQFGPGVELRFSAAAADVIPRLLEEAQHLDRVSLTAGLDDPVATPVCDVVIPDGEVSTAAAPTTPVYTGSWRLIPRARVTTRAGAVVGSAEDEVGSALQLHAVGREVAGPGWNWAFAAYGEAEQGLAVERLLMQLASPLIPPETVPGTEAAPGIHLGAEVGSLGSVPIFSSLSAATHADAQRVVLAANRERAHALQRRMLLSGGHLADAAGAGADSADRPLARDEARPVAAWIDGHVDVPLESAPTGTVARAQLWAAIYSRAATNPILIHLRVDGSLRVVGRSQEATAAGSRETVVITTFDGVLDPLVVTTEDHNAPPKTFQTRLRWRFGTDASGRPTLLGLLDSEAQIVPAFEASAPAADRRRAAVGVIRSDGGHGEPIRLLDVAEEWTAQSSLVARVIPTAQVLSSLDLHRDDTALDTGQPGRDLAEAAIESIGAELSPADRDPQFAGRARALLFPAADAGSTTITARRDWVFFRRHRDVTNAEQVTPTAQGVRRYRAYHATVPDRSDLPGFGKLLSASMAPVAAGSVVRSDDLGFQLVSVLEFREGSDTLLSSLGGLRTAWAAGERGTDLLWQGGGDVGTGDGEDVLRRRIDSYRSALSGLVDAAAVRPAVVLSTVPDEFVGIGTDGAIFTIGLAAPVVIEVTRVVQRALAVTADQFKRLLGRLTGGNVALAAVDEAALRALLGPLDIEPGFLDIEFTNDQLTDAMAETVKQWWMPTGAEGSPTRAQLLIDSRVVTATGNVSEETRTKLVLSLLGGPARAASRTFGPIEDANAIVAYIRS